MIATLKNWMSQLKALSNSIFAFLALILGSLLFIEVKRNQANKELLKNDEVKQDLSKLNDKIVVDGSNLETEETKRKLLEDDLERKKNENNDDKNLVDFFSNRK